jgi:hypothetical protein
MSSSLSDRPTELRLRDGAIALGRLWQAKERCKAGWSADECGDATPSKFCRAKLQWALLAIGIGREVHEGEYSLALSMSAPEFDLTRREMKVELVDLEGAVPIGGGSSMTMTHFAELSKTPEAAKSILTLMKKFPGSKMEFPKEEVKKT